MFSIQVVWFPPLLLKPRTADISGYEEEDKIGTIRVPKAGVDECVPGRKGAY